jgi:glycosyltransferase involved in cell wall biosynthesis
MCGGTENQFMALGRALDPNRFRLEFACLRRSGGFVQELGRRGIPLHEYSFSSFLSLNALGQQAKLRRYLRRRRIDIVHTYNFYGNVFAIPPARLAATPVVIASIRDRGPYLTPTQRRVQRHVCQLADRVLVNADAVRDWLIRQGYDESRIVVIRNGVDLNRFAQPAEPARLQAELALPPQVPVVTVVSRLHRLKGIEHFLEATAILRARFPEARFLIVGETNPQERDYQRELFALSARLGLADRVVFTGLRTDVPDLLAGTSVSVMPSLNEALSNVLLESMAAGVPVVATRVGGTPEVIEDGVNGLLVPPADPMALANAIGTLLADPSLASRLGRAGRRHVDERFSMARMVSATERLYQSLLEHRCRIGSPTKPEFACK